MRELTYAEALVQQELVWNAAWAGLTEEICGMEALPFTPLHYVRLALAQSPFLVGGREPDWSDVENFVWCVSPLYDPQSGWNKFRHWMRYYRLTRRLKLKELVSAIDEYLYEAWQDSPPQSVVTGVLSKDVYCPVVSLMSELCPAFNLTPALLMKTPYKQLFQLGKRISARLGLPVSAPADAARARERGRKRQQPPGENPGPVAVPAGPKKPAPAPPQKEKEPARRHD